MDHKVGHIWMGRKKNSLKLEWREIFRWLMLNKLSALLSSLGRDFCPQKKKASAVAMPFFI